MVVLYEDNMSQYFGHFLKTYLAEGVVREHKNMIVDPEPSRSRDWWIKFLPQVSIVQSKPDIAAVSDNAKKPEEEKKAIDES